MTNTDTPTGAITDTPTRKIHWTQSLRTAIRPIVTLIVICSYCFIMVYAIWWLLQEGQTDNALGLLSGIAGVATGIVGFWFGTRGKGGLNIEKDNE